MESYELACEAQRACPDTLVLSVADREGDIHEWFSLAQNKAVEERAALEVRVKEVELCGRRCNKKAEPVFIYAVYAKKNGLPKARRRSIGCY